MDEATKEAKQQLLANYQDRLLALRQRQALMQDKTPADLVEEIQMLEQSVVDLRGELGEPRAARGVASSTQAPAQKSYIQSPAIKGDNIIVGDQRVTGVIVGSSLKTMNYSGPAAEIENLLQAIEKLAGAVTGENKIFADRQYDILTGEALKGPDADDQLLATAITELARLVPGAGEVLVAAFKSPLLAKTGGRATGMALGAIKPG